MSEETYSHRVNSIEIIPPRKDLLQQVIPKLPKDMQDRIRSGIAGRQQLLRGLVDQSHGDAGVAFQTLFDVPWTGSVSVSLHVYAYGAYFAAERNPAYEHLLEAHQRVGGEIGGAACTRDGRQFLVDHRFDDMIAFGRAGSEIHEKMHLFSTLLPVGEHHASYLELKKEDATLPLDDVAITGRMWDVLHHFHNGILKDELLARIENDQILKEAKHTKEWRLWGTLYDNYGYRTHNNPYTFMETGVGRKNSEDTEKKAIFWERFFGISRSLEDEYIAYYNACVQKLQARITARESKAKIIADFIVRDFEHFGEAQRHLD